MLTRRETLRSGTAAVAVIAAGGAVAAAVPAVVKTRQGPMTGLLAADEPVIALVEEIARPDDPILGHWRWYQRLKKVYDANSAAASAAYHAGDIETCKKLEDKGDDLDIEVYDGPERAIAHTVATTLEGCLIQARLLASVYVDEGNWREDQDAHLAQNLLAGLERLAGEAAS